MVNIQHLISVKRGRVIFGFRMFRILLFISLLLVSLLIASCAGGGPPTIYLPQEEQNVQSIFRSGIPIGTINNDNTFMMASIEPSIVAGTKYMRLWLLIKNQYSESFLFEPLKSVSLTITGDKQDYKDITPTSPSEILSHIENERASALISEVIGGVLEGIQTTPTTLTNQRGEVLVINDRAEKTGEVIKNTVGEMTNTTLLYDIFMQSVNSGILRRNTISTSEGVNGFMYFPLYPKGFRKEYFDPEKYNYTFTIITPDGKESQITFKPGVGE